MSEETKAETYKKIPDNREPTVDEIDPNLLKQISAEEQKKSVKTSRAGWKEYIAKTSTFFGKKSRNAVRGSLANSDVGADLTSKYFFYLGGTFWANGQISVAGAMFFAGACFTIAEYRLEPGTVRRFFQKPVGELVQDVLTTLKHKK